VQSHFFASHVFFFLKAGKTVRPAVRNVQRIANILYNPYVCNTDPSNNADILVCPFGVVSREFSSVHCQRQTVTLFLYKWGQTWTGLHFKGGKFAFGSYSGPGKNLSNTTVITISSCCYVFLREKKTTTKQNSEGKIQHTPIGHIIWVSHAEVRLNLVQIQCKLRSGGLGAFIRTLNLQELLPLWKFLRSTRQTDFHYRSTYNK